MLSRSVLYKRDRCDTTDKNISSPAKHYEILQEHVPNRKISHCVYSPQTPIKQIVPIFIDETLRSIHTYISQDTIAGDAYTTIIVLSG